MAYTYAYMDTEPQLPNNADFSQRLTVLEEKIEKTYASVEKIRKYFFWTTVVTVVVFVVPLIGLAVAIPFFLTNYVGGLNSMMNLTQ
jgi:hypothetical protein